MIIEALMDLIYAFFSALFSGLAALDMPSSVVSVLAQVMTYLESGAQIVAAYTHFSYLLILLDFVVILDMFHTGYMIFMWIMKKVPMWGMR